MKPERLHRAILPDVLIDNFDIDNFDKSADRFDIYLDEKKVQLKEDKTNPCLLYTSPLNSGTLTDGFNPIWSKHSSR